MDPQPPDVTILYGSQTGNAEDLAKRIGLQAKRLRKTVRVETMDDFMLKMLPKQNRLVLVCSTTGHGQEPENMRNFYNFIRRRDLPKDCLSNLNFAVYGLGDSSYTKFNYVSKILFKRLVECGAKPMQDLTLGDEQHLHGCDGAIYPKLTQLWSLLDTRVATSNSLDDDNEDNITIRIPDSSYAATLYEPIGENACCPKPVDVFSDEMSKRYDLQSATCLVNQRVTDESHFQDTRFLQFKADSDQLTYEPGDVCTIYPENFRENVIDFMQLLKLNPSQRFRLSKRDPNYMVNYLYDFIPDGLTIEDLVTHYLDIQSVPKRSFFEYLWPFSEDPLERDKLKEFASTEGQEEVYDYCVRPKRSILEVLGDFPNTVKRIKFEYLFDLVPPIKPRSFSIASAIRAHPGEVHLIVGVVKYRTSMRRPRHGLCSNYLASLVPLSQLPQISETNSAVQSERGGGKLRFFIRSSSFRLPLSLRVPIIMVGPGLGIAPFRSFIEERALRVVDAVTCSDFHCTHKPHTDNWCQIAAPLDQSEAMRMDNHLYFGCRFNRKDYYFKEELERYAADKLVRLRVAFSRESPNKRQYVQDLLLEDSSLIRRLMGDNEQGALLYVAGNSKLPEELRTLIGKMLLSGSETNEDRLVAKLEASNRILYDCW